MRYLMSALFVVGAMVLNTGATYGQPVDELFKLLPDDGANMDHFGRSVAIGNSIAIVGSPGHDDNGNLSGAAYLFDATTGLQLFKLLPVAGAALDGFGSSVAIHGNTAIVGAWGNDDNGNLSGSAYLFDTTTGQQLFQLQPENGSTLEFFGHSVAISGDVAIVGAHGTSSNSGAAYLFDITSGAQLFKLVPNDGAELHAFGVSVAISGTTAIVGKHRGDDACPGLPHCDSGSAYLFDTITGLQIFKLVANDDAANDLFGETVGISGNIAIVGAWGDDDNGDESGSAYLFNTTTGLQIAKLLPNDGTAADLFGQSVSIAGPPGMEIAIVGARFNDENGFNSGAAYLFDGTGNQIAKLVPGDNAQVDHFGTSVAINDATAIAGAVDNIGNGTGSGSAYVFGEFQPAIDTDGDGLLDSWETVGIPYTALDGTTKHYILDVDGDGISDADPLVKDLFVELDHMVGLSFPQQAVDDVEGAFWAAPVLNPDGQETITLHLIVDDGTIPFEQETVTPDDPDLPGSPTFPANAATIKGLFFGTEAEQLDTDAVPLLEAKAKAYRYCIFYNKASAAVGGLAELGGDDFMIFAGTSSDIHKASVFMHELGHTLNLHHGGGDEVNGKPNYPSIMNYMLIYKQGWNESFWRLDYSRELLATIDESLLDETTSAGNGGTGFYDNFIMPYFGVVQDGAACYPPFEWNQPVVKYASLDPNVLTDLNLDCDTDDIGFAGDLNFLDGSGLPGSVTPSPGQPLFGHDDWANIELPLSTTGGPFAGPVPTDELTETQLQYMEDNFPPPPGIALPPTVIAVGPRYLEVTPDAGESQIALLVTSDDEPCVSLYVQTPETINGHVIGRLGESVVLLTPAEWGTVNVSDEAVLPGTSYTVRAELANATVSDPTTVTTWAWADANNTGVPVDFDDILCVLEAFAGNFAGACSFFGADLEGGVTNVTIDFDDVLGALEAFSGAGYFDNPTHIDPCP